MYVRAVGEHVFVAFRPSDRYSYSYLLGLFLGDGHLGVRRDGGSQLLITCDLSDPEVFCEYCDRLGIRRTQSNHRNISVSHRHSVAAMDEFIGPKR